MNFEYFIAALFLGLVVGGLVGFFLGVVSKIEE